MTPDDSIAMSQRAPRRAAGVLAFSMILGSALVAHAQASTTVVLPVGTVWTLPSDGVASHSSLPGGGPVDVRLSGDGRSFVVRAMAPGQISLLFIYVDGRQARYTFEVPDPVTAQPTPAPAGDLTMHVGDRVSVSADGVVSFTSSGSGIDCDVASDGQTIVVTARAVTDGALLLFMEDGSRVVRRVTVLP